MEFESYTSEDPLNALMIKRGEITEPEEFLLPYRETIIISQWLYTYKNRLEEEESVAPVSDKFDRALKRAKARFEYNVRSKHLV